MDDYSGNQDDITNWCFSTTPAYSLFNINYLATPGAENDSCDQDGSGFSVGQGDCDDSDSKYFPGRFEILNSIDDDCDGDIDEGTLAFDDDGDGFTEYQGDCDDNNSDTYPGASIKNLRVPACRIQMEMDLEPTSHAGPNVTTGTIAMIPAIRFTLVLMITQDGVDQDCDGADAGGMPPSQ